MAGLQGLLHLALVMAILVSLAPGLLVHVCLTKVHRSAITKNQEQWIGRTISEKSLSTGQVQFENSDFKGIMIKDIKAR